MTHTPAPWSVEWGEEEGNDGVTIESSAGPVAFRVLEVDARLIAAAPEMLKLLRDVRLAFEEMDDDLIGWRNLDATYLDSLIASTLHDVNECICRVQGVAP